MAGPVPCPERWVFERGVLPCAFRLPPGHDGSARAPLACWPVVLFLHGAGECGTDGRLQSTVGLGPALRARPEDWPFVAVLPQKPWGGEWEDHAGDLVPLLDGALARFGGDPDRVLLTGLSHGGYGTWALARLLPDRWAALVPMCGYLRRLPDAGRIDWRRDRAPGALRALAASISHLPVWAFHGEKDRAIPVAQSRAVTGALLAAGADARLTTFPEVAHACWEPAFAMSELPAWMLRQRRRAPGPGVA